MQRAQYKCPKCRAKCVNPLLRLPQENVSNICIADDTSDSAQKKPHNDDFKIRVWSYLRPPGRISESLPAVSPERLEEVRERLEGEGGEKPISVHVDSNINLKLCKDGKLHKISSRTERKTYPGQDAACQTASNNNKPIDFTFVVNDNMSSTQRNFP